MATINISEADFEHLANAAGDANDKGDVELAKALDKIARKMNAALSNQRLKPFPGMPQGDRLKWTDVPSTLI